MIEKTAKNELNACLKLFSNQAVMGRILARYPELARTINNYKKLYELETKEHAETIRGGRPRLEDFKIDCRAGDSYIFDERRYLEAVRVWENGL